MYTLGINAAFHDSAACLVRDGEVVAAAEEERFSRIKHGKRPLPFTAWELPYAAIDYCLAAADIRLDDVQHVAYAYEPRLFPGRPADDRIVLPVEPSRGWESRGDGSSPWDPLFYSYILNAPRQLTGGAPLHLQKRLTGNAHAFEWHYVPHHVAHEASAFLAAPVESAAVLTLDGRGERASTTCGVWRDGQYRRLRQIDVPHSLGLLYEQVTHYLGFLHSSDEYKVMALASYGQPVYLQDFRDIVRVDAAEGRYQTLPPRLEERFGPARARGAPVSQKHYDIAASLQKCLEETVLRLCGWLREQTGEKTLVMAGGVALNCVMNARIRDSGLFETVWVQPAAGDAGTALGAALWVDWRNGGRTRPWVMDHAYLGPSFDDATIEEFLRWSGLAYERLTDPAAVAAELLAGDCILGWFQDRMEFGPRALGARSILASPISPHMQARLNELKDREDFRPVAPAVLAERMSDWFITRDGRPEDAPFMLFIYDVKTERKTRIPAACHVDGTARVQTVSARSNPRYYDVLRAFEARTGVPILVNTSFNSRSEPIVCTPRDAVEAFYSTPLDALVIGSYLLTKPRARAVRAAQRDE